MSGQPPSYDTQYITLSYPEQNRLFNEAYGFSGSQGLVNVEGVLLKPRDQPSKTVFFFMHPATPMDALPVPRTLAAMGFHVLCGRNRYYKTDHVLIFEKVLLDVGEWLRYAKEQLGYEKVVLYGWSGGGALSVFYQSEAENPTITETPAGDPVDVRAAGLIPADAVIYQAASASRARILSEGIDPSVRNEHDPEDRDVRLDIYSPDNPNQPPYSSDFVAEYRAAQLARMRRITARVKDTLRVAAEARRQGDGALLRHPPDDGRPALLGSGGRSQRSTSALVLQRRARNGEHRAHRGRPVLEPAVLAFAVVDR